MFEIHGLRFCRRNEFEVVRAHELDDRGWGGASGQLGGITACSAVTPKAVKPPECVEVHAFDTVEAGRPVSLETAPDSDALLAFEIIDDEHVSQTGGTIDFDLVARAATTFAELVDVRNQGTQTVTSLQFEFDVTGGDQPRTDVEDALRIVSGDATIDATGGANLLELSHAGDADNHELSHSEAVPFGIEVDLTGDVTKITGDPEIT